MNNTEFVKIIELKVLVPPSFAKSANKMPKKHVKPAGNVVQLRCKANGVPLPNITWYKDGKPYHRKLGDVKYAHWGIMLEDLVTDDNGLYQCIVCNIVACINYTYELEVLGKDFASTTKAFNLSLIPDRFFFCE